jgi:short-subunit dehydrogenase
MRQAYIGSAADQKGETPMSSPTSKGVAVVTGASAGIGAVYADRLAKRGYDLILVARNEDRLKTVAHSVESETGRKVKVFPADLSDKASLAKVEALLRDDKSITVLVNNAGIGSVASILQADVETMTNMIALNITALTRLTYAVTPAFVARGNGTIINIASVVGIAAEMLNGVYSASKSYVISFGHSLQKDLAGKGVRVQTVLPGATATEFWDVAGYAAQKTSAITMSAEDAVDAALVGLDNGELVTIPGLHDGEAWDRWEADRRELSKKFGNSKPALRYGVQSVAAA